MTELDYLRADYQKLVRRVLTLELRFDSHIEAERVRTTVEPSRRTIVRALRQRGLKGRKFAQGLDEQHFPHDWWDFASAVAAWDYGDPFRRRIQNIRSDYR